MKDNTQLFAYVQRYIDEMLELSRDALRPPAQELLTAIIARQLIQQNVVLAEIRNALEEMAGIHRGV